MYLTLSYWTAAKV